MPLVSNFLSPCSYGKPLGHVSPGYLFISNFATCTELDRSGMRIAIQPTYHPSMSAFPGSTSASRQPNLNVVPIGWPRFLHNTTNFGRPMKPGFNAYSNERWMWVNVNGNRHQMSGYRACKPRVTSLTWIEDHTSDGVWR
uniref:Uncharacterized protein n=1 Tax=Nelumbo nucifera TaxID=4432 RepID=A0A822XH89_NELNU|nr:TPA_asm: hypothetical protein HUJ06_022307 [Nelumbo nucifera]